ncbi:Serine/threonine-protein phosphatase 7 long form-like [Quillaja saponaria]|uniref:Serine/threonine-protein phosphatase 7 long form-like n=1 Tax=Quillaja saponaria TaxID=32244 RepID=A0AAD7L250_QUISA|nr:Serine/threonine-protein phosphatase 7 long form-like [Quillaja saponaria]
MDPVALIDVSVLRLHDSHRSVRVFADHESEANVLRYYRREVVFGREILNNINPCVLECMTMIGFGGVIRVRFISLDWHLVTALIKRWRSETHTFHLPHGEITITLQDVSILFGLPVDGQYSCGSASLAWLYREMCYATHLDASEIAGPLILLQERGVTDYHWLHANHIAIWGMRYNLVQTGDLRGVAHGHAARTPKYNDWYRHISRRYLTRVDLIHADPAPSYSTHSTPSSSLSSQRRRRSRTDVPGQSISYGRVDADVRPSDVYIPSPAHMSPSPYMASSSSMYHQLMPNFAQQSSEVFNFPIPQVPYFQYGSTPASYDPSMGSSVRAEEGFSGVDDIP